MRLGSIREQLATGMHLLRDSQAGRQLELGLYRTGADLQYSLKGYKTAAQHIRRDGLNLTLHKMGKAIKDHAEVQIADGTIAIANLKNEIKKDWRNTNFRTLPSRIAKGAKEEVTQTLSEFANSLATAAHLVRDSNTVRQFGSSIRNKFV